MKTFLLAIILVSLAFSASAQTSQSTTTFGIRGGLNLANVKFSANESRNSFKTGTVSNFSAGIFADIAVNKTFSVQPGLFYSGKGYKFDVVSIDNNAYNAQSSIEADTKRNIAYLEVPVNFVFNIPTTAGKFYVGAGPFASVAVRARVNGSVITTVNIGGQTQINRANIDQKLSIGSNESIKRMDYGATSLAGFRFNNGISVNATYDLGLANILGGNGGGDEKTKTRTVGFSLGLSF